MELNPFLVKSQRASERALAPYLLLAWEVGTDFILKHFRLILTTLRTLHLVVRHTSVVFYLAMLSHEEIR